MKHGVYKDISRDIPLYSHTTPYYSLLYTLIPYILLSSITCNACARQKLFNAVVLA